MRVVISGICGRTGRLVADAIASARDMELVAGIEAPGHECTGMALREMWNAAGDGVVLASADELDGAAFDVLVDFSVPEQAVRCAAAAARTRRGLVSATTGLTGAQEAAVREAASSAAVVVAPNTSVGANLMFALLEIAASALDEDYDIEVVEAHHRGKRDAPSGTALRAVDVMAAARGSDRAALMAAGRSGLTGPRRRGEIGVHSIRGGAVAGRHTIRFMSEREILTIEHVAITRGAFAHGAVLAARFAAAAAPGLYDMLDVLGLRRS